MVKEKAKSEKMEEKKREIEHEHAHNETHAESQQEKMFRLNMLEQDARQLEQQIVMVEQQILELQILTTTLDEIEKAKEKDEMLAPIGKNIFVKTELLGKELLVNVGAKTLVKKSIPETKTLIEKDIANFSELKNKIALEFQEIVAALQEIN